MRPANSCQRHQERAARYRDQARPAPPEGCRQTCPLSSARPLEGPAVIESGMLSTTGGSA